MSKNKRIAFYITATTDLQDMSSLILRSEKECYDYRVYVIDCLTKKRQFKGFDLDRWSKNIVSFLSANSGKREEEISRKILSFKTQKVFEREYKSFSPDYVILQNIHFKYPRWIPTASNSKVLMLSMHHDAAFQTLKTQYKIEKNSTRRKEEIEYFSKNPPKWFRDRTSPELISRNSKIDSFYPGNLRAESLNYKSVLDKSLENIPEKSCLILSTQERSTDDYKSIIRLSNRIIKILKREGFTIYWKSRKKGYPETDVPFVRDLDVKPDVIIGDDYTVPSSLSYLADNCQACFTIQTSTAYWDLKKINNNSAILVPDPTGSREPRVIDRYYRHGDCEIQGEMMIYSADKDFEKKIIQILCGTRDQNYIVKNKNASLEILRKIERS